jgi:N,N-dimethylformamidase
MDLVGYCDPWSVAPGETIRFMVGSAAPTYEAAIVRLIHGDPNPAGPGFKEERVPSDVDGTYPGQLQTYPSGSSVLVPDAPALDGATGFTLWLWVWPTTPGGNAQGLLTKWDASRSAGYALVLDKTGAPALWLGDGTGNVARVGTDRPLRAFSWYLIEASYDPVGEVRLRQEPQPAWPVDATVADVTAPVAVRPASSDTPFVMAGWCTKAGERPPITGHFNGKLDGPRLERGSEVVAAWDFARDIPTDRVEDLSGNGRHGQAINMPTRGVTGHNYSGREVCWRLAPEEYGAIFFHDDDLEDAGWETAFAWTVPTGLRSGVYAVRLWAGDAEDHVPFFVRPPRGTATAPIAFLAPTFSYLAYGNEHITWRNPDSPVHHNVLDYLQKQDRYADRHRLLSLYDHHADGTGNCYASRRRPLVNMRPKYDMALLRAPHQFNADLHLVDWLEAMAFPYDVIADDDLHAEGAELLRRYRVVVTGSHHEYWSTPMLDGLEGYLADGGRLLYLSGNGLYWPVGVHSARPHVIEVRRGQNGTGTWRSAPGENFLSTTGEPGGLWRDRGRAPQRLVGVGMAASGFDVALPFRRLPASSDPRYAWIFDGVGTDEPIGDAGLVMGGAAGLEIDRADPALGTPPHAVVLATATGFSDSYTRAIEEVTAADGKQGGTASPAVRGDIVFFDGPKGGAVFAAGSITWCGSLSHNAYQNPVSRITANVLRAFAKEDGR